MDLRPAAMSNHEMGYVFEHLLRKFNEALNENPGEHFTPRDGIRLMVDLVLMLDTELAGTEGVTRTVNDCGCGTGGTLSITKDHILQINPQAKVFLYGQELNPFTWAIARADRLILEPEGKDAENIKLGSTLSQDQSSEAKMQVVSEAEDNFRKDGGVRLQPSGARQIAKGSPQGERGGVHQFGDPPKGNANLAWGQHFIHRLASQGIAGFVLAKSSMEQVGYSF